MSSARKFLYIFLLIIYYDVAFSQGPPPPPPCQTPPCPTVPIDTHVWILFVAGILFGCLKMYRSTKKSRVIS